MYTLPCGRLRTLAIRFCRYAIWLVFRVVADAPHTTPPWNCYTLPQLLLGASIVRQWPAGRHSYHYPGAIPVPPLIISDDRTLYVFSGGVAVVVNYNGRGKVVPLLPCWLLLPWRGTRSDGDWLVCYWPLRYGIEQRRYDVDVTFKGLPANSAALPAPHNYLLTLLPLI